MIENLRTVKLIIEGEKKEVNLGLSLKDLAKNYQDKYEYPILLAKIGNEYHDLSEKVESDRYNIITKTRESQNATLEFISQIDVTIEGLHEMIHEYEREIDHLERELRAREASQNRE